MVSNATLPHSNEEKKSKDQSTQCMISYARKRSYNRELEIHRKKKGNMNISTYTESVVLDGRQWKEEEPESPD